jgi:type I restriction enzyme, S subunit
MNGRNGARSHVWQRVKLGEVCDLVNGDAYRESDWSTTGVPIIRIQNLNDAEKPFNYWRGDLDDRVVVNSGDVLLAWSGTPGTSFGTHLWERGLAVLNQHIFRVDLNKERLDSDYAVFAINEQLEEMIGRAHGAVGLRHVTRREVESLEIPLPPLEEQRRIAARLREQLSILAEARAALEAQLGDAESLPAAHLRAVFESEQVKDCPQKRLGEVCRFVGGMQPSKGTFKYAPAEGYVRLVQIQDFRRSDVPAYIRAEDSSRRFNEDDVMIGRYGPPLFQILRGLSGAYNVALIKTVPSDLLLKEYLYFLLQEPCIQNAVIAQSQRAAGQTGVQKEFLENLIVPIPSISKQRAIATRLEEESFTSRQLRDALRAKLSELEKLPAALLRAAFSPAGEVD